MVEYLIQEKTMHKLATAIREKAGVTNEMTPDELIDAVYLLETSTQIVPTYGVTFYDYDGTVLYSYSVAEARTLIALPDGPTHEGVTFAGWTHTLEEVTSVYKTLDVGAMYTSETTQLTMNIEADNTTIPIFFQASQIGGVSVDWGDGMSSTNTTTTYSSLSHTYTSAGEYNIKLSTLSGTLSFGRQNGTAWYGDEKNASYLKSAILGNNIKLFSPSSLGKDNGFFRECINLQSIILCKSAYHNSTLKDMFAYCSSLKCIIWSEKYIYDGLFNKCLALSKVIFRSDVNTYYDGITSKGSNNLFSGCENMTFIDLPNGITRIGRYFLLDSNLDFIYIRAVTPPILDDEAFLTEGTYFPNYYVKKIYVPVTSVDNYKTSENWSRLKNRIHGTVF